MPEPSYPLYAVGDIHGQLAQLEAALFAIEKDGGKMESPPRHDPRLYVGLHWFNNRLGGRATMASYGVDVHDRRNLIDVHKDAVENVPQAHVEFLKLLKIKHVLNNKLFVHAGISPDVALDQQSEDDLLWIRQEFHAHQGPIPIWSSTGIPLLILPPITAIGLILTAALGLAGLWCRLL